MRLGWLRRYIWRRVRGTGPGMWLEDSRDDPILPVVDQGDVMGSIANGMSEVIIEGNSRDDRIRCLRADSREQLDSAAWLGIDHGGPGLLAPLLPAIEGWQAVC